MEAEPIGTNQEIRQFKEDTPYIKASFRVSVFGSGSEKSEHDENAIFLAGKLASAVVRSGHKVVTGGYESGIMGAVSKTAQEEERQLEQKKLIT